MNQAQNNQQQNNTPPPPPKPTYSIRTYWLFLPISFGILAYILKNTDCVISWHSMLDAVGIVDKSRITKIFILMTVLTVIVIINKILRKED